jgi:hypothetical protein
VQRAVNPGAGEMVIVANPKRKTRAVRIYRRRKAAASSRPRTVQAKAANPHRRRRRTVHLRTNVYRRRRRHNPQISNMLKLALWGSVGAVGTRAGTQLALGASNTSWLGYLGNLVAAYILGWLGEKGLGPEIGNAIAAGGGIATVLRIASEQFFANSSLNQYLSLSGLGDAQFSFSGVGDYVNDPFLIPTVSSGANQMTTWPNPPFVPPAPPPALPASGAAAPAGKGMHGLGVARWQAPFQR